MWRSRSGSPMTFPCRSCLDGDKVAWAVASLVGTALRHVRRGTQLMPGGSIDVNVRYDAVRERTDDRRAR